jgi:hypothetical protein
MAAKKSLYEILGVEPDANDLDIGLAHQRRTFELKRIAQPDPNALGLVQQAFEILSNPGRREAYDASLTTAAEKAAAQNQATDLVVESEGEAPRRKWIMPGAIAGIVILVAAFFLARPGSSPDKAAPAPVAEAPKPAPPPPPQPMRAEQVLPVAMRASGQLMSYGMSGNAVPLGIAFSIEPNAVIATCHGIAAGSKIVFRQGAETLSGELNVVDEELDLCRLAVVGLGAKPLAIAAEEPKAGDKVFTLGVNAKGDFALTEGTVKQVRDAGTVRMLELSTPIAAFGSGAPVLDAFGRLVGVATTQQKPGIGANAAIAAANLAQMRSRTRPQ